MKKRVGVYEIAKEMYGVFEKNEDILEERIKTFVKKLDSFIKMVYQFDFEKDINISNLGQEAYDMLLDRMKKMAKDYNITNIDIWISIKNPEQLYFGKDIKYDTSKMDFYYDFRKVLYDVYKKENADLVERKYIQKAERYKRIYCDLHIEMENSRESNHKREIYEDWPIFELQREIEKLNENFDTKRKELTDDTKRNYLNDIMSLYTALLKHKDLSRTQKFELERKIKDCRSEWLKYQSGNYFKENFENDYLRLSLLIGESEFPYNIDEPEYEKIKDKYERCLKLYKKESGKLLDEVIKQVETRIQKESEEQNFKK